MYCSSTSKKWYITDRKKELIKVRGFQVSPAELEGVILSHPGVADAAVIGITVKTDPNTELPRAYVVVTPGALSPSEEEIVSFCAERLAKYKKLTGGVRFVDAIPRNAAGKALKRVIREMLKREEKSEGARL
jgi:acyl-CoA synthetase (AMP-forming)/AMP-acid ligase II